MAKTELDVITRALREIGVTAHDETPSAGEGEIARETWRALFQELDDGERMAFDFTFDAVPERLFLPLARVLASRLAMTFSRPPMDEMGAMALLRRQVFPDDRGGDPVRATYF